MNHKNLKCIFNSKNIVHFFLSINPPPAPGLLPVLGPLEWYMTPTLDTALLYSSRAGSDLGRTSDGLRSFVNWVSSFPSRVQWLRNVWVT